MPDERESPSAGWREVYREMDAAEQRSSSSATQPHDATTDVAEATRRCPDCGRTCRNVLRDVYECADHGVFRPTEKRADAPDEEDVKNPAPGTAD